MENRPGIMGMEVGLIIKLVGLLLILAAMGWGALQVDVGGYTEAQEIRSFVGDVDYRCGTTGSDPQEDVSTSVPETIKSVEVVDGNVINAEVEGGESIEVESSACEELIICAEGDSGPDCEGGGTMQTREVSEGYALVYSVWYPGNGRAVIDPER